MARIKNLACRSPATLLWMEARSRRLAKAARMRTRPMVRRYRPNVRVQQEIRKFQKSSNLLIPLRPFQGLVKEIASKICHYRFQSTAILALQEASEAFIVGLFEEAQFCSLHVKRKTVTPEDMRLAMSIRGLSQR